MTASNNGTSTTTIEAQQVARARIPVDVQIRVAVKVRTYWALLVAAEDHGAKLTPRGTTSSRRTTRT
jgi:hypothetical protein